jgi:hypothetical protein
MLDATHMSNLGLQHLKGLKKLRMLTLDDTQVGDDGISDLTVLTSLETLIVPPGNMTEAGIDRLRKALPRCRVNE